MKTTGEMYFDENVSLEHRQGFRSGLEKAYEIIEEYKTALKQDGRVNELNWVNVCSEHLDDELSMYQVGDEE
jgi:hypothetical protein